MHGLARRIGGVVVQSVPPHNFTSTYSFNNMGWQGGLGTGSIRIRPSWVVTGPKNIMLYAVATVKAWQWLLLIWESDSHPNYVSQNGDTALLISGQNTEQSLLYDENVSTKDLQFRAIWTHSLYATICLYPHNEIFNWTSFHSHLPFVYKKKAYCLLFPFLHGGQQSWRT